MNAAIQPELFDNICKKVDNICKKEIIGILDGLEHKCLKEREEVWHKIIGFSIAHINWFEKLKGNSIEWEIRGFKNVMDKNNGNKQAGH